MPQLLQRLITRLVRPPRLPWFLEELLVWWVLSLCYTRYEVYAVNQAIQLPLVAWLNQPDLYPQDAFVATLSSYASLVWLGVAWLHRVIPLEPLLLTLYLGERLFLLIAASHAAWSVTRSRLAISAVMALFALAPTAILASGTIVVDYFEQTGLFIPFFLMALAAFYQKRPIAWAIWLGLGFNLNSMYGVYALTYFAAAGLVMVQQRQLWRQWLWAIGLFGAIALPSILWTMRAFGHQTADPALWLTASQVRFPHHLYPLTWEPSRWLWYGLLWVALLSVTYTLRRRIWFCQSLVWSGISLLWLGYAYVAAYVAQSPAMLVMHPGRATDLWCCFVIVILVGWMAAQYDRQRRGVDALRLLLVGFLVGYTLTESFDRLLPAPGKNAALIGAIGLLLGLTWGWPRWGTRWQLRSWRYGYGVMFGLAIWVGIGPILNRIILGKSLAHFFVRYPLEDVRQVAAWAKASTPLDAMFLVNPYGRDWDQFRALADRPILVHWKDGSAILWDRAFVTTWAGQLRQFSDLKTISSAERGSIVAQINQRFNALADREVRALQAHYPIRYWVAGLHTQSSFPVVFQTQDYKVLQISQ